LEGCPGLYDKSRKVLPSDTDETLLTLPLTDAGADIIARYQTCRDASALPGALQLVVDLLDIGVLCAGPVGPGTPEHTLVLTDVDKVRSALASFIESYRLPATLLADAPSKIEWVQPPDGRLCRVMLR
jgi:hypothetical protein